MARRAYALALVALAAGAVGLLAAYGMTWAVTETALLPGAESTMRSTEVTGATLYPGAAASGWVALAAVAGIIATRSWGRILVAALAAVAGVAGVVPGVLALGSSDRVGLAWLLALAAGAVVAIAGVTTAARGRGWPTMGGRYERRGTRVREVSAWEAQDLGQDPTDDLVE